MDIVFTWILSETLFSIKKITVISDPYLDKSELLICVQQFIK